MESRPERNIPQFNGDCYAAWKFRIKTVLEELQVYSVIEKSQPVTPDAEWTEKNRIAKCTIVSFLGDAFLHYAEGSTTAKSIIDDLDKLYAKRNLTAQVALRKQLADFKLLPNLSLRQHFGRYDKLISDLKSSGANIDEMDKVCQLLASLPPCYDGVIAQLEEFYGDNFNLAIVKTQLLDQEAKIEMDDVSVLKDYMTGSLPVNNRSQQDYRNNRNMPYPMYMHCDFCGRQNHFIQDCHHYNSQSAGTSYYKSRRSKKNFQSANPSGPPKGRKRQKNITYPHQNLEWKNVNPYAVPVKLTEQPVKEEPCVKSEPVEVKQEPVCIKEEPVWVKQEPQCVKEEPQWDQC